MTLNGKGSLVKVAPALVTTLLLGISTLQPSLARAAAQEPGGRFRVLVVPLESDALDKKFGEKVAEEIRERLQEFSTHVPVPKKEFERAMKRYEVKWDELNAIKARQLANLMGAQVLFYGTVKPSGALYELEASFIDSKTGDEVAVPAVTIRDKKDESVESVADAAIQAFEEQVRFVRARAFCAEYVGSQQPENALRNCNEALGINANSVPALFNKALAFRQLFEQEEGGTDGWADSAVSYFSKVLDNQPGHADALQNAAYIHSRNGDAEKASELYKQYLEFDPGNVPVRIKVAYDLAQAGLMVEAIEIVQEGLEFEAENVDLLQTLGDYALRHSSDDSTYVDVALVAYEQVLEIKGEETEIAIVENALAAYTRAERTDEAITFAQKALESHSDSPRLWSLYADALADNELYAEAAAAMDHALELDPAYPNGYSRRGSFKLQAGDDAGGLADFHLAVESGSSTLADVYNFFWGEGHSARNTGNLANAARDFERASKYAEGGQQTQELEFWWGYTFYQLGEGIAQNDGANLNQLKRAQGYFESAQQHLARAGAVRAEVPQIKNATGKWILNIEARIKQLSRS